MELGFELDWGEVAEGGVFLLEVGEVHLFGRDLWRDDARRRRYFLWNCSRSMRACRPETPSVVEIPDALVPKLAELARREGRSEADVVSAAVQSYVEQRTASGNDPAFGLWRERAGDGLDYQNQLRAEWPADESRL